MAQKFMYGVGSLSFGDKVLGYIEKGSFKLGGKAGEVTEILAEQVQTAAVKSIPQSNATIAPTFSLIEIDYQVMQGLLGGSLRKDNADKIVGWDAPREAIVIEGPFKVELVSGHVITIQKGMLQAFLDGDLVMTAVAKLAVTINVQVPDNGEAPYSVLDKEALEADPEPEV